MKKYLKKQICMWLFAGFFVLIGIFGAEDAFAQNMQFRDNSVAAITDAQAYPVTGEYTWIRYKAKKNGYIQLQASYGSGKYTYSLGYWRLYASDRRTPLSADKVSYTTKSGTPSYTRTSYFGVKKGKTYYLRVQAYDGVKISCKFKAVSEKSAASRKKAKQLKQSKTVTGTVLSRNKTADWYKIRLKKAQKIQIFFKVRSDGRFRLRLYSGAGKELASHLCGYSEKTQKLVISKKSWLTGARVKMDPGVYYLRIDPENSFSTGYYTLKWK